MATAVATGLVELTAKLDATLTAASAVAVFGGTLFVYALPLGQVFRYEAQRQTWDVIFKLTVDEGTTASLAVLPTEAGFDALYLQLVSAVDSQLWYSEDGLTFAMVEEGEPFSLQHAVTLDGKLHSLTLALDEEVGDWVALPVISATSNPAGEWQAVSTLNFGDSLNDSVSGLVAFGDCLWVATSNATRGFQVWKSPVIDEATYPWQKILDNGTHKYNANETVAQMVPFGESLYILTGSLPSPGKALFQPEVLKVETTGEWDLMVGSPRFTPTGFKIPLSGMGAGFDAPYDTGFYFLVAHDDKLHVGTKTEDLYELWSSSDGETWESTQELVFGGSIETLPYALSTALGLVLGTVKDEHLQLWLVG